MAYLIFYKVLWSLFNIRTELGKTTKSQIVLFMWEDSTSTYSWWLHCEMTILNDHVPSSQELYCLSEYIEPTFICSFLSLSIFLMFLIGLISMSNLFCSSEAPFHRSFLVTGTLLVSGHVCFLPPRPAIQPVDEICKCFTSIYGKKAIWSFASLITKIILKLLTEHTE